MLSVTILDVVMLIVIMLNVVILSVVRLSGIMLNVVILSVIMLNVATPCKLQRKMFFFNTSPGHLKFGSISRKSYNSFFLRH